MYKIFAFSFYILILVTYNPLVCQNDLIVKGKIEIKSIGEGLSCGMTSQPSNYKTVILVKNRKDSVKTESNELNEFEFPPIDKKDTFQIIFPFQHTNSYLNQTAYFTPIGSDQIYTYNTHRERIGTPILSEYEITNQEKITQVYLNYALFCFLNKPYEPAGLKLHDFTLQKANIMSIEITNMQTLVSNFSSNGTISIAPEFGFKIEKEALKPIYIGFSWENINIKDHKGVCHSGGLTNTFLNCKLNDILQKMHHSLSTQDITFKKNEIGNNLGFIKIYPQIMFKIEGNKSLKPQENVKEQDYTLKFVINNKTKRTLYFSSKGFKYEIIDKNKALIDIPIPKGKSIEIFVTKYAMNNPANHITKPWEDSFPKLFFESYKIQYGKTKLFLSNSTDWTLEKNEFIYTYTLEIEE